MAPVTIPDALTANTQTKVPSTTGQQLWLALNNVFANILRRGIMLISSGEREFTTLEPPPTPQILCYNSTNSEIEWIRGTDAIYLDPSTVQNGQCLILDASKYTFPYSLFYNTDGTLRLFSLSRGDVFRSNSTNDKWLKRAYLDL